MSKKIIRFVPLITFIVLTAIIILLSPIFEINLNQPKYFRQNFVDAEVLEVISEDVVEDELFPGRYTGTQQVKVGILEGTHQYEAYVVDNPLSNNHYVYVQEGDTVIASIEEKQGGTSVWLYNYKRDTSLYILVGLFVVLLLILGRKQGAYSILSLTFTCVVIIFFMMPLIFRGYHPVIISILSVIMIAIVSFMLISGITKKSLIAITGTIVGVFVAGLLSFIFGEIAMLSGVNMDKGQELVFVVQDYNIQVKGLMFSAILIASLGAVMDVAMSISSSMEEIHKVNSKISINELFKSGMNVGRDIMGTMSNTLILAFVGSSFNTIMLILGYQMVNKQFMNIPFLGVEIIQGISGSIGIILTVPITALIAAFLIKGDIKKLKLISKKRRA